MKVKFYRRALSALCALLLALTLVPAAGAAGTPASSDNFDRTSYDGNHARRIFSYLYANEKNGLTRVEYLGGDQVVIEEYDSDFRFVSGSQRYIKPELNIWGRLLRGKPVQFPDLRAEQRRLKRQHGSNTHSEIRQELEPFRPRQHMRGQHGRAL